MQQRMTLITLRPLEKALRAGGLVRLEYGGGGVQVSARAQNMPDGEYMLFITGDKLESCPLKKTGANYTCGVQLDMARADAAIVADKNFAALLSGVAMGAKVDMESFRRDVRMRTEQAAAPQAPPPAARAPVIDTGKRSAALESALKKAQELFQDRSGRNSEPYVPEGAPTTRMHSDEHKKWFGELERTLSGGEMLSHMRSKRPLMRKPVANPFPRAFAGGVWRMVSYAGMEGAYYIIGNARLGRRDVLIVCIPGAFDFMPPPWLREFGRFLVSAAGEGYWVCVADQGRMIRF